MSPTARTRLGLAGEQHVRRHLERQGWSLVVANWRCRAGELDLVMRDGDVVVFVEVKTRHGELAGRSEESISQSQAQRILRTAELFLSQYQDLAALIWRVDIVGVTLDRGGAVSRLTHLRNAVVTG